MSEDEVFFCCGIPYTYSDLQRRLEELEEQSQKISAFARGEIRLKIQDIGKSLGGLEMPALTFEPSNSHPKKYIVINARTHPGEFSSSWVMDGVLQKLVEA